jgi:tripartite-type tricarboxylate transporter receptor subunit TctC
MCSPVCRYPRCGTGSVHSLATRIVAALVVLIGSLLAAPPASAQRSERPLRFLVGFPPGGGLDSMTRVVGEHIHAATGRTVVVENKAGAAGRIAAEAVVRGETDGSLVLSAPIVTTAFFPFIYNKLGFDPLRDLAPITRFATFQFALAVGPQVPANTVAEFIAYLKTKPATASYGSLSPGTPSHFLGEMFKRATGTDMTHVPYRGSAPALIDLQSGQITAVFDTTASVMQLARAGKIKVLAVTGGHRSERLPDAPTFAELKLGLGDMETADLWYGFFAPGGTSPAAVQELNGAIAAALRDKRVIELINQLDCRVEIDTPAAFAKRIADDYDRWGPIIRSTGFKVSE